MKNTVILCDVCHCVVVEPKAVVRIERGSTTDRAFHEGLDLCQDCFEGLERFLRASPHDRT